MTTDVAVVIIIVGGGTIAATSLLALRVELINMLRLQLVGRKLLITVQAEDFNVRCRCRCSHMFLQFALLLLLL